MRSKKIIDFITQQFVGAARTRWLSAPENTKPRCLENHRWEGQAVVVDGEYGFYGWIKRNFISPKFKEAKYNELQHLSWQSYPQQMSKMTGKLTPRNMQDFISWYKEALEISGTNWGDILNQKTEFFRRIDPRIITEIRTWEVSNPNPTMEQIYAIAQGFEMNHTGMTPYMGIAPLTNRNNNKSTI